MIRTFALPSALAACLLAAGLGGCATGEVGPTPPVHNPLDAADVTIFRDGSWVGLWAPIVLRIDGRKVFHVGRNETFNFPLPAGEYVFDYAIGFNECRRVARVSPRGRYRFRLAPNCAGFNWGWRF
jgi:hypothetical protein